MERNSSNSISNRTEPQPINGISRNWDRLTEKKSIINSRLFNSQWNLGFHTLLFETVRFAATFFFDSLTSWFIIQWDNHFAMALPPYLNQGPML